jgi:hypothetical protein
VLKLSQIVFVFEANKDDDAADEVETGFLDKIFIGPQYISIHSCGIVRQASTVRPLPFVVISFM